MTNPFELSKATKEDKRQGAALVGGGVASLGVGANQNRIGQSVANSQRNTQSARLRINTRRAARVSARPKPSPPQGQTWAQVGKPKGLSSGAARRQANVKHVASLKRLTGKHDNIKHLISEAPKLHQQAGRVAMYGGPVVGAGLLYAGSRKLANTKEIKKYTKKDVDRGAEGAVGGAVAYHGVSGGTKPYEAKHFNKPIKNDPVLAAKFAEHKKEHGITPKSGSKEWLGFFRKYPTDLPGSKFKRTMSYTHGGKSGLATQAATVAAGGALAVHASHGRKVNKNMTTSAFGVEHQEIVKKIGRGKSRPNPARANPYGVKSKNPGTPKVMKAVPKGFPKGKVALGVGGAAAVGGGAVAAHHKFGKSAFGVEHEITKISPGDISVGATKLFGGAVGGAKKAKSGFGAGFKGTSTPSPVGRSGATKLGGATKTGLNQFKKTPVQVGTGIGAVGLGGGVVAHKNNRF